MNLTSKVTETINRYKLFKKGDRVIVAVSGGPDSVTLCHMLNELRYKLCIRLYLAHLNHGLRKSADSDQRFTQNLAKQLRLPFITAKVNLSKKKKGSIEELARNARIDFFSKSAKSFGANCIALGHTQDDLGETILMRILRGSGLSGLRGMLSKRKICDITFVRPLIEISRKEVEQYLKKERVSFCIDPTNKDTKIFRNKIRLHLMPLLEGNYNKNIREVLSSLANNSAVDYQFLEQQGTFAFKRLSRKSNKNKKIQINLKGFLKIHPALRRMVIRLAIENLKGNTRRLTLTHTKEVEDLVSNRPLNSIVNLPDGIIVSKSKSHLNLHIK